MKDIGDDYDSFQPLDPLYQDFKLSGRDYYDWMTYLDLNFRLPELLLARLDRMTMAASIEGRVPFMDHKFVELCLSINPRRKVQEGEEKFLLKKYFDNVLPNEILYRPKDGFSVPLDQILFTEERTHEFTEIIDGFNEEHDIFDLDYLKRINEKERSIGMC